MTAKKMIITSALPYANGSIHIGHLVEYVQTDILVRFMKLMGHDALYCCADDTHGTPIEFNAKKQGITPEELIARSYKEHLADFEKFNIKFDSFHSTNSEENRKLAELVYSRLKEKGCIYEKEMELTYCEHCERFLPDRFVKGECPKCGAQDQYGDQCEVCNTAYQTTDLIKPFCTICKNTPTRRKSKHLFFKLSDFSDKLKTWLEGNDKLQSDVKNQIMNWIKEGLQDWCISRDGPYFGFKIPDSDKYFYVWLDAPIGYISSTAHYFGNDIEKGLEEWNQREILHVIGKDIIYFHWLFWPAMLMAADIKLPDNILVHGFLTVNKEKMSKSRGTFLTAQQFLDKCPHPELLRFYYAANLTSHMIDIDLDLKDFRDRINNELVSNIANLFYRTLSFLKKNFDGVTTHVGAPTAVQLLESSKQKAQEVCELYEKHQLREVVKKILEIGAEGNKYFQDHEPWKKVKGNEEEQREAHEVLSACVHLVRDIAILMSPIMPDFSEEVAQQINLKLDINSLGHHLEEHTIGEPKIILSKIDKISFGEEKVEEKKEENNTFPLNLKVGKVVGVDDHPDADKLYVLSIDLGSEKRQLVAGLKAYLEPGELLEKHVVIVSNLEPAKLRGVESQGMLLAAEKGDTVIPLQAPHSQPGDAVLAEGLESNSENINYKQFTKVKFAVKDKTVTANGALLSTEKGNVVADIEDGADVC